MSDLRRPSIVLTLALAASLTGAHLWNPAPPPPFRGLAALDVPRKVAGLTAGADQPLSPEAKAALASADVLTRTYADPADAAATPVQFTLIGGTDRSALHDPRSCLVGSGWQIVGDRTEDLTDGGVRAHACRALDRSENDATASPGYDVLYLYVVDGRVIDSPTQIRARMLAATLLGRRGTPVYFLRFMAPIPAAAPGGGDEAPGRRERLRRFAREMWGALRLTDASRTAAGPASRASSAQAPGPG